MFFFFNLEFREQENVVFFLIWNYRTSGTKMFILT